MISAIRDTNGPLLLEQKKFSIILLTIYVTVFFSIDTKIETSAPRTDILSARRKTCSVGAPAPFRIPSASLGHLSSTVLRMSQAGPPQRPAPAILLTGTEF